MRTREMRGQKEEKRREEKFNGVNSVGDTRATVSFGFRRRDDRSLADAVMRSGELSVRPHH